MNTLKEQLLSEMATDEIFFADGPYANIFMNYCASRLLSQGLTKDEKGEDIYDAPRSIYFNFKECEGNWSDAMHRAYMTVTNAEMENFQEFLNLEAMVFA